MTESNFPTPGSTFEGRYLISAVIGAGGFSRVYKATQVDLERPVAIKVLDPDIRTRGKAQDEVDQKLQVIARRFDREAKLVSALRDSHTITMHDYGRTDSGMLYMVLEYVDGLTVHELVEYEGPLAPKRVVKILRQCLSSLDEAHALGVLHRDIKPANIMVYEHVGRKDQVKVLDFGIAKTVSDTRRKVTMQLTGDGMMIGTPRYMSPEQIRGDVELGPPSDIYSLGLVAHEMLTGRSAVEADSSVNIIAHHLAETPIELPKLDGLPDGLRYVVDRMVHKNHQMRFQSAQAVLDALDDWDAVFDIDGDDTIPTGLPLSAVIGASGPRLAAPKLEPRDRSLDDEVEPRAKEKPTRAASGRSNLPLFAVAGVLLLATVLVFYNLFARPDEAQQPSEAGAVDARESSPTIRAVEAALAAEPKKKELDEEPVDAVENPAPDEVEIGGDEPAGLAVGDADAGVPPDADTADSDDDAPGEELDPAAAAESAKVAEPAPTPTKTTRKRRRTTRPARKVEKKVEETAPAKDDASEPSKFEPTKKKTSGGLIPLDRMQ